MPQLSRLMSLAILVITTAAFAVGCNTMEGAGQDVEDAGEAIEDAAND